MSEQLDLENDVYILVRFLGKQSAAFEIHPANVSPVQMITAGIVLVEQGKQMISVEHNKRVMKQAILELQMEQSRPPDIVVPSGVRIPNAKPQ